jgi:hypothetical protein
MGNKFLNTVIPWDKEIQHILERLAKDRVAYTKNYKVARSFSSRHPELINNDFLDIVTTRYGKKEKQTIFVLKPNVVTKLEKKRFCFHKIF